MGKLKKKIHRERANQYKNADLITEIAKLEEFARIGRREIVGIAFNDGKKYHPKEIVNAYKTILWAESLLFEAKLNAGIFNKIDKEKKGSSLTPEQKELMHKALSLLYGNTSAYKPGNETNTNNN